MKDSLSTYRKAIKVIESSTNQAHIDSSRTYINLFFKQYSTPLQSKYSPLQMREADNMVSQMYGRLYRLLEKKEKSLK